MRTHPLLYEINTRCWLNELSEQAGRRIDLSSVPEELIRDWRQLGFTHIWLMGVWRTGPHGRQHALEQSDLWTDYRAAFPQWQESDVWGSPYAVADYKVSEHLGGERGLAAFRDHLREHGLKLILDFVPNHLALDHPWLDEDPELFVHGLVPAPETFPRKTTKGFYFFAHGKDPYFPAWGDTVQLDYRHPRTRTAMIGVLREIARQCDGVRCDMAMLLINEVFGKVWQYFSDRRASAITEFWFEVIDSLKRDFPDLLFLAEVYWGLDKRLQDLGFDYTYDKSFFDCLFERQRGSVHDHLLTAAPRWERSLFFLENHDEARVASRLALAEHRAAALLMLSLPGMRLIHEGQLAGARHRVPVHLGRRFPEPANDDIKALYAQFLAVLPRTAVGSGLPQLLQPTPAWEGNPTARDFVVIQWQNSGTEFDLIVVNLAPHRSQCYVTPIIEGLAQHNWHLKDLLGPEQYDRVGREMTSRGLYLDLPAHGAQLFHFEPIT